MWSGKSTKLNNNLSKFENMGSRQTDWDTHKIELKNTLEYIYENRLDYSEIEAKLFNEDVLSFLIYNFI